jgi:hypothetical protein
VTSKHDDAALDDEYPDLGFDGYRPGDFRPSDYAGLSPADIKAARGRHDDGDIGAE